MIIGQGSPDARLPPPWDERPYSGEDLARLTSSATRRPGRMVLAVVAAGVLLGAGFWAGRTAPAEPDPSGAPPPATAPCPDGPSPAGSLVNAGWLVQTVTPGDSSVRMAAR